jgi:hypothetical protein
MKIALISLLVVIIQEMGVKNGSNVYKAVSDKGDTGFVYTSVKHKVGDTIKFK